jgi:hypothetical protein
MLLWKSIADLGIASRFLANSNFNEYVCGASRCTLVKLSDGTFLNGERCGVASAYMVFFQIASELWFVCVAMDLVKTLQNPFSSTKAWFVPFDLKFASIHPSVS